METPSEPLTEPTSEAPVLTVRDLTVEFRTDHGWARAVDGLSYTLTKGRTLGVVGESGSGKSVTNLALMRLLPTPPARIPSGEAWLGGRDILKVPEREMRQIRGNRMAMIFQDPMTALNPYLRIRRQLVEVLETHQKLRGSAADALALQMLARVGLPDAERRYTQYPHQFSGGMRQRVMIAMMLLNRPEVLIADEPTTALDVTIQAQILDLLKDLQAELGMAVTLITHDLGVVAGVADEVIVLYAGQVMERGTTRELFAHPAHAYTLGLLRSLPRPDLEVGVAPGVGVRRLYAIPGRPPDIDHRSLGCPFAPRCEFATQRCTRERPPEVALSPTHQVRCFETDAVRAAVRPATASQAVPQ